MASMKSTKLEVAAYNCNLSLVWRTLN